MILVTGAAGRLGRRVIDLLVAAGRDVVGTDVVTREYAPSRFVQAALCDVDAVSGLVAGSEAELMQVEGKDEADGGPPLAARYITEKSHPYRLPSVELQRNLIHDPDNFRAYLEGALT